MPTYEFRNKDTNEITEVRLSIHDLDKYKDEHPELERYFGNQINGTTYGIPKQSDGFKSVMQKIQSAHPGANLSNYTWYACNQKASEDPEHEWYDCQANAKEETDQSWSPQIDRTTNG